MPMKEDEMFEGIAPQEENEVVEKMPTIVEDADDIPKEKTDGRRKKRVVSEATKERLREQLKRGRETSARNRAAKAMEKKIAKEDEQKKRAKVIADYNDRNDKTKKAMSENDALRKRLAELEEIVKKRSAKSPEPVQNSPSPPPSPKERPPTPRAKRQSPVKQQTPAKKQPPPATAKHCVPNRPKSPPMSDAQRQRLLMSRLRGV